MGDWPLGCFPPNGQSLVCAAGLPAFALSCCGALLVRLALYCFRHGVAGACWGWRGSRAIWLPTTGKLFALAASLCLEL